MKDIKVIVTDLSEVLIGGMVGIGAIIEKTYGSDAHRTLSNRLAVTKSEFFDLMRGRLNEQEYWSLVLSGGEWPDDFSIEKMMELFSKNMQKKIPQTLAIYKSAMLPNGTRPAFYSLSDHIAGRVASLFVWHKDVFSFMDKCYWSFDMGVIKRDYGSFDIFLEKAGLDRREIIFIDDSEENIASAKKSGILSIRFKDSNQIKNALKDHGLLFDPIQL